MQYLTQGLLLGLAYVAPIGMQNLYVIRTAAAMPRLRAYQVAFITTFFDISLALACYFGIGLLLRQWPGLTAFILGGGALVVSGIGISLMRSSPSLEGDLNLKQPLWQVVATCFAVTWLNPQALIDGSMLIGGVCAALPLDASRMFLAGVCLASLLWFSGITTAVSTFRRFLDIKVLRVINWICGGIVVLYGLKLAWAFLQLMKG